MATSVTCARRLHRILAHVRPAPHSQVVRVATAASLDISSQSRGTHNCAGGEIERSYESTVYSTNENGSPAVRVETSGPVATVILDRAGVKNAIDGPTANALANAFRDFDKNENVAVAVLWGGGGTFCAGADLKAIAHSHGRGNRLDPDGDGPLGPTRMLLSKPVIAAVSGYAVAGGLELALWCDMRVVEDDATFGVFCRRFGVPLIDGGSVRLPRLIGLSHAMDLILTGRAVDAAEALRMGLANRIVPKGRSRSEAEALAHKIAAFPQLCMRGDRMSALQSAYGSESIEASMRKEFAIGQSALTAETLAGARRFADGGGRHGAGTR